MKDLIYIAKNNIIFCAIMLILNSFIIANVIIKLKAKQTRYGKEAKGRRNKEKSLIVKINKKIVQELEDDKESIYTKAKIKMKKAGYKSKYAALTYLVLKYMAPLLIFILAVIIYPEGFIRAIIAAILCYVAVEFFVYQRKLEINKKFQRHIYKLYKYLHNQISSGVTITEAIKTVYKIIDDKDIQMSLIRMAATYELTNDINIATEEITVEYDNQEAETLAVAIKQGITTGDDNLLEQQEELMFSKYMNYIQAETDRRVYVCLAAALAFAFIIVVMVSMPMIMQAITGIEEIFTY